MPRDREAYNARLLAELKADPAHAKHMVTGYRAGCRCRRCTWANSHDQLARRNRAT